MVEVDEKSKNLTSSEYSMANRSLLPLRQRSRKPYASTINGGLCACGTVAYLTNDRSLCCCERMISRMHFILRPSIHMIGYPSRGTSSIQCHSDYFQSIGIHRFYSDDICLLLQRCSTCRCLCVGLAQSANQISFCSSS